MTGGENALAAALLTAGALVHGSIGFGFALVAAPMLVRIDPALVPGPLILAGTPLMLLIAWRDRDAVDLTGLRWPVIGQLGGTVAAIFVLQWVSRDSLAVVIGAVVLLAVVLSLVGFAIRPSGFNLVGAGVLSGFMGTTASIPGPPLALVHQHVSASRLRGTLAPFFIVGNVLSLGGLWWAGHLGGAELRSGFLLMPAAVAGFVASRWTARYVDQAVLRRAVLLLSSIGAGALILGSL
jgi:uncharacterized membrane protein YfcA